MLIQKILESDFKLVAASTPEEILRLVQSVQHDLLLIDILFLKAEPGISGYAKSNRTPVIALSSEPNDARDRKLLERGCCACYIKPIRQHLFLPFVSYWIGQYTGKAEK